MTTAPTVTTALQERMKVLTPRLLGDKRGTPKRNGVKLYPTGHVQQIRKTVCQACRSRFKLLGGCIRSTICSASPLQNSTASLHGAMHVSHALSAWGCAITLAAQRGLPLFGSRKVSTTGAIKECP